MNGMTTTAVCAPHPNPLPKGARGWFTARINLWGFLSPVGEGWGEGIRPHKANLTQRLNRLFQRLAQQVAIVAIFNIAGFQRLLYHHAIANP